MSLFTALGGHNMNLGVTVLGILAIIAAIWVIYDVVTNNRGLSSLAKILWIVFAIFFSIITAIIYFLVYKIK
jgi:hypothetical protein